jgi:uncharacterized lipoprotein YehR (DUF1307 family)
MKSCMILLAVILMLPLAAVAQDKPNFSGKWGLDTGKSDFGEFPVPDSQTNVIEHKGTNIKLTQTIKGDAVPGGVASSERHYTTDGKESSNKVGQQELTSICKWDGNKLVIDTKLQSPDGPVEIKDSWELTDGGKRLVATRVFKGPQGERSQRLVFNQQE